MGLAPADFWSHTLPEWNARRRGYMKANGAGESDAPLSQAELADLMARYPDDPAPSAGGEPLPQSEPPPLAR